MKLTLQNSIRAIEYAADQERETRDFYRTCLDRASAPGTRAILSGLIGDEDHHRDILLRLITAATGNTPTPGLIETEAARVRLERAFSRNAIEDPSFEPDRRNVRGILEKALEIEKESFSNYLTAAEESTAPEVAATYRYLAGEENKHYIMIENLLSYLDVPGRWLYYEENLVFQNG